MNKKTLDDNLNFLKGELDKGNNFVDYFLTIGLNSDAILENWLYEADIAELNSTYKEKIAPEMLTKFPPFDKTTINVDESMIKHCFPRGYQIIEKTATPPSESFSFILDNNYFSINYPQKYVACLLFYENLGSYKKLHDKFHNFENDDNISVNKCGCLLFPPVEFSSSYERNRKSDSSLINISKCNKEDILSMSSTLKSTTTNLEIPKISRVKNIKYKYYYVPKCICLISVYPFFVEFNSFLKSIYNFARSTKTKKPLEKIIENLVIEVPVPPRGLYSVEYLLFNEKKILVQSCMNKLPSISLELDKIFIHFNIDQILEIFKHVMLETKILFFSSSLNNLTPIIQGFISLTYPFKYPFQVVTILPEENFHFIESVSPYILGINMNYDYMFFVHHGVDISEMTMLIVDINNRKVELSSPNLNKLPLSSTAQRKKLMNEEFPDLPKHYTEKIELKLTDYVQEIKSSKQKEAREEFTMNIQKMFFNYQVSLFQSYNKYLNNDYYANHDSASTSIYTLFQVEEFLNSLTACDRPFYKKLITDTQMFVDFIYKRMIPKDSKEKLEILLFDESIIEKVNRKMFSSKNQIMFITSTLYDIRNTYSVQKSRNINETDIIYFRDQANRRNALKYGQFVSFENDELIFSYPVFPTMMIDVFFRTNVKDYFIPPFLSEELEPINVEMVSKSHLGKVEVHHSEMENYIYLCWIQLWAFTFWYHDEEEKRHRFQQLLKILDLVINHEMEIFNLLFDTISKHGEDYMLLKLYERLIHYRLNPSFSIYSIISKLVDRKKILENKCDIVKYINRYDYNQVYDVSSFRKRTFKNKYDVNIVDEDVVFYTYDSCIDCQNSINLEKLSRDFNQMKRDILWATCPFCGSFLLPKIGVGCGQELNKYGKLKLNTSTYDAVVLYSPFFLKYNYNNGLLKEFGIKLDVENFKIKFNAVFWDSIWYFKIKNLQFDFMLPYEKRFDLSILDKSNCNLIATTMHASFSLLENQNSSVDEEEGIASEDEEQIKISIIPHDSFSNSTSQRKSSPRFFTQNTFFQWGRGSFQQSFLHLDRSQEIELRAQSLKDVPPDISCAIDAALVTEQSFVTNSMIIDNTIIANDIYSAKYLDSEASFSLDIETVKSKKNPFAQLHAIKEDADEHLMIDMTPIHTSLPPQPLNETNQAFTISNNTPDKTHKESQSSNTLIMHPPQNQGSCTGPTKSIENISSIEKTPIDSSIRKNKVYDLRRVKSFKTVSEYEDDIFAGKATMSEQNDIDKTPVKTDTLTDKNVIQNFRDSYSILKRTNSYEDVTGIGPKNIPLNKVQICILFFLTPIVDEGALTSKKSKSTNELVLFSYSFKGTEDK